MNEYQLNELKLCADLIYEINNQDGNYFKLDISAFATEHNNKIISDDYFVFYNNRKSPCFAIKYNNIHQEKMYIDLEKINKRVHSIFIAITMDNNSIKNGYNFNELQTASLSIKIKQESIFRDFDSSNNETYKPYFSFDLSGDFANETAILLVEIYYQNQKWFIRPVAKNYGNSLAELCHHYGVSNAVNLIDTTLKNNKQKTTQSINANKTNTSTNKQAVKQPLNQHTVATNKLNIPPQPFNPQTVVINQSTTNTTNNQYSNTQTKTTKQTNWKIPSFVKIIIYIIIFGLIKTCVNHSVKNKYSTHSVTRPTYQESSYTKPRTEDTHTESTPITTQPEYAKQNDNIPQTISETPKRSNSNAPLPYTTINVNIRACANGDCDSKGVIPKGSFVYPVFNNDELTVKDDWWLVDYSGYLCESKDYAPKSGCSQWQSNRSVRGWIHFSAIVIDIDLNQYSVKQLGTEFSPLITKNHVNIRKCFSSTCDSIGVIPKSSQIQPLLDNNGHLIMAKKWLAVWYSGQFCHPDSQNCANRLSARTVRGWIHMDKLTAHIDLDKYTTNSSDYLITTRHTNIRSCGATSCASLGVIPQGHYVYPLFNNDKIVGDGDWVAVEYSGGFCAEDSDDCSQHSSRRTVRGWMNIKTFQ